MPGCVHRDLPSTEIVDQPDVEPGCEAVPDEPVATWIAPGVSVRADLAMPPEHERGVCRCDACRARGTPLPRFT